MPVLPKVKAARPKLYRAPNDSRGVGAFVRDHYTPGTIQKSAYKKLLASGQTFTKSTPAQDAAEAAKAAAAASLANAPYSEYAAYPWAQRELQQLDRQQASDQANAGKVGDWLSQSLTNLTGPSGINTVLQQQYLANQQGIVGGAYGAAAAATPGQVAAGPGGISASPTAYLSQAAREGAAGHASSDLQSAQMQSALNSLQPNTQAQGYEYQLAAFRDGLPAVYAQKRADARTAIDKFIMQDQQQQAATAETNRHNLVTEAISGMNAQTQAAIGLGNLGVSSTKAANTSTNAATNAATSQTRAATGQTTAAETRRHNLAQEAIARTRATRAVAAAGTNKPLSASAISSMNGKWAGTPNKAPKLGAGWKQPVWDPGTKAWYAKRASGSATTVKPLVKAMDQQSLITKLTAAYDPAGTGTIATRHAGDPKGAAQEVVRYILDRKNSFTTSGRKLDKKKLLSVIQAAVGGPDPTKSHGGVQWHILDLLQRGYLNADGTWK